MAKASGRESDPLIGFQFAIEVGGMVTGYFTECGGIGSENEIVETKFTTDDGHEVVQKIPGRLKWNDVTLKRGITDNLQIWEWRQMVEDGKMKDARKNCSIIMMDRNYTPAARWDFVNAWPSKVSGPEVKSDSNDYGIEEMTLVHEGMKRTKA
ncbi:MAG: phage tail protein [Chloroflexi bacterium]|nr:phage tail protein [Chloroflexota bacterium]